MCQALSLLLCADQYGVNKLKAAVEDYLLFRNFYYHKCGVDKLREYCDIADAANASHFRAGLYWSRFFSCMKYGFTCYDDISCHIMSYCMNWLCVIRSRCCIALMESVVELVLTLRYDESTAEHGNISYYSNDLSFCYNFVTLMNTW